MAEIAAHLVDEVFLVRCAMGEDRKLCADVLDGFARQLIRPRCAGRHARPARSDAMFTHPATPPSSAVVHEEDLIDVRWWAAAARRVACPAQR